MEVLVVYGTTEGHTRKIAEFVARVAVLERQVSQLQTSVDMFAQTAGEIAGNLAAESAAEARKLLAEDVKQLFQDMQRSRGAELATMPTRALLDYYEKHIEPTGKPLRAWLKDIGAHEKRYRQLLSARNRSSKRV